MAAPGRFRQMALARASHIAHYLRHAAARGPKGPLAGSFSLFAGPPAF